MCFLLFLHRTRRSENEISNRQLRRRIYHDSQALRFRFYPGDITNRFPENHSSDNSILNHVVQGVAHTLHDFSSPSEEGSQISEKNVNNIENDTHPLQDGYFIEPISTPNQNNFTSKINDISSEISFRDKLASWAVSEQISHVALQSLLKILKTHLCHSELPSDPRALLRTPRNTIVKEVHPGFYWHYGLENGIKQFLKIKSNLINDTIELVISIDGLPISQSSGSQLWPILGSVFGFNDVFIIGMYHGSSKKPDSAHTFLETLVEDSKHLIENGIIFNNKKFQCLIKLICADAPAKSFILNVKGHTGYSSCTKCWDEGEFLERRICFSDKPGKERTDEEFFMKSDENYHLGSSPLDEVPLLGLVTNVPLD